MTENANAIKLAVFTVAIYIAASTVGLRLLYYLSYVLAGVLIAAFVWSQLNKRGLRVKRQLKPTQAQVGQVIQEIVEVRERQLDAQTLVGDPRPLDPAPAPYRGGDLVWEPISRSAGGYAPALASGGCTAWGRRRSQQATPRAVLGWPCLNQDVSCYFYPPTVPLSQLLTGERATGGTDACGSGLPQHAERGGHPR